MCIRDRIGEKVKTHVFAVKHVQIPVDDQVNALRQGENPVCLLYTSDAADDLLCVDLGGRRIIKKKK